MTAIAAIASPKSGQVWMAGDSVGYGEDGSRQVRRDLKVFTAGEFALGVTNSFRLAQVLTHEFTPPPAPPPDPLAPAAGREQALRAYMVTGFVPALRTLVTDREIATDDATQPLAGEVLVGWRGRLFEIQPDYQVAEPAEDFWAAGAGASLCLGALAFQMLHWATGRLGSSTPEDMLTTALEITARYNVTVGPPYLVVTAGG